MMAVEHVEQLTLQGGSCLDATEGIRPGEGAAELERIVEGKLRGDVPPDPRRGRGGKAVQADPGQQLTQTPELSVLGSEVMSPLADAVSFVHGNEADPARRQER